MSLNLFAKCAPLWLRANQYWVLNNSQSRSKYNPPPLCTTIWLHRPKYYLATHLFGKYIPCYICTSCWPAGESIEWGIHLGNEGDGRRDCWVVFSERFSKARPRATYINQFVPNCILKQNWTKSSSFHLCTAKYRERKTSHQNKSNYPPNIA